MINGGGTDLSDFSMLDLFRSEMEMHAATLNEGLLALENDPGATDHIESLMRAAHSIKGGARIVELDAAVKLAHTMEDCFVAAQKGDLSLSSDAVDVLLKGVDMLNRISDAAGDGYEDWLAGHRKEIDDLAAAIARIHSPGKADRPPAGRRAPEPAKPPAAPRDGNAPRTGPWRGAAAETPNGPRTPGAVRTRAAAGAGEKTGAPIGDAVRAGFAPDAGTPAGTERAG